MKELHLWIVGFFIMNIKHGNYHHPLYKTYSSIMGRCYNKNNQDYHLYGGRGITFHWKDSMIAFFNYIQSLSNCKAPGYSLDRKDNEGNYEPDNLRWSDRFIQAQNKRKPKSETGFTGVKHHKANNKYVAVIGINGSRVYLGSFNTIIEAIAARNQYIITNNLVEYPIQ